MTRWTAVPVSEPESYDSNNNDDNEGQKGKDATGGIWNRLRGWQTGILGCIILGTAVLILNIAITVASYLNPRRDYGADHATAVSGLSTFYSGSCSTAKTISQVTHLLFNVVATALLSASNYCAQVLASPTRGEIDAVHGQRRWLRIGVPNFQNLRYIPWSRSLLCFLLTLSSLPLHLLWNSAIVLTVSSNDYFVGGVAEEFATSANSSASYSAGKDEFVNGWFQGSEADFNTIWPRAVRSANATNLTAEQCIDAYGEPLASTYGSVALVFDVRNSSNSLLFCGKHVTGADTGRGRRGTGSSIGLDDNWVCGLPAPISPTCEYRSLAKHNDTYWTPLSLPQAEWSGLKNYPYLQDFARANVSVQYCLAEVVDSPCRVGTTPSILVVGIVANALKLVCFVCTWFLVRHKARPGHEEEERIVTNGDLIASYLRKPDVRFSGRCLASSRLVRQSTTPGWRRKKGNAVGLYDFWNFDTSMPMPWQSPQDTEKNTENKLGPRWYRGPTRTAWLTYILPSILCILALFGIFFGFGLQYGLFLGFGQPSTQTTISLGPGSGPGENLGIVSSSLIANTPQIVVTYMYVAINAVLTSMMGSHEVSRYASALPARGLRVSFPREGTSQRSTYYLHLPWRIGLPLMGASTVLHWFLSQSLFLLRVAVHNPDGSEDPDRLIATVGYSSPPILASLAMLVVLVLGIIALGWFKRYDGARNMPLVANCSASLAAATCPAPSAAPRALDRKVDDSAKLVDETMNNTGVGTISSCHKNEYVPANDNLISGSFDGNLDERELLWGVVVVQDEGEVMHATFSARPVGSLIIGHPYA